MMSSILSSSLSSSSSSSSSSSFSSNLQYYLSEYWNEAGDPRTRHLFLIGHSFTPFALILTAYLLLTFLIVPRLMAGREPYRLKPLLIGYNLFLSLWNAHFLYRFLVLHRWGADVFDFRRPSFEDHSPLALEQISLQHVYLLSKLVDLFETIFFVLRKKPNQITALHTYHHFTGTFLFVSYLSKDLISYQIFTLSLLVPIIGFVSIRLVGNSRPLLLFGLCNSFIHTVKLSFLIILLIYFLSIFNLFYTYHQIMYGYYGLSAFGPHMQPYLWWKRYITQIQIIQFAIFIVVGLAFVTLQTGHHWFYLTCFFGQSSLYLVLFIRFYLKTYKQQQQKRKVA